MIIQVSHRHKLTNNKPNRQMMINLQIKFKSYKPKAKDFLILYLTNN